MIKIEQILNITQSYKNNCDANVLHLRRISHNICLKPHVTLLVNEKNKLKNVQYI